MAIWKKTAQARKWQVQRLQVLENMQGTQCAWVERVEEVGDEVREAAGEIPEAFYALVRTLAFALQWDGSHWKVLSREQHDPTSPITSTPWMLCTEQTKGRKGRRHGCNGLFHSLTG